MFGLESEKDLQSLNTLAVPAVAAYYYRAQSIGDICEMLTWAERHQQPVFVLGGGSNVILNERVEGLVLSPDLKGVELIDEQNNEVLIKSGAGENWHEFVDHCLQNGYYGVENLALIPGTVGAAPIQNIGAYGVNVEDVFETLEAINCETKQLESFSKADCAFAYRDSVFKNTLKGNYIITSVTFRLSRLIAIKVEYPALKKALVDFDGTVTPRDVFNTVVDVRQSKLPEVKEIPNVGSFFKNPILANEAYYDLEREHSGIVSYMLDRNHRKLAAAWLIESCGWKGEVSEGICVYEHQALVITNHKRQSAKQVLDFAAKIQASVKQKFGVMLEIEPQCLGFCHLNNTTAQTARRA
ncbi:MAG: UDP-N-acetylenolpyruvoylglucosamine reductase [Alteromonadaceae bacterium]|nr:MAG: UDP-N-acetylenolpyruvoylglucosamine reductase [Alteromonadaceae bacterium]